LGRQSAILAERRPTPPRRIVRARALLKGLVQGVGMRPFVANLARRQGLAGYVLNTGEGVETEVEGEAPAVEAFFAQLLSSPPPLARIFDLERTSLPPSSSRGFEIRPSLGAGARTAVIPPDAATCEDCLAELLDPGDRRFGYPFINCTNCGPRYTLIEDLPYDRRLTSMKRFTMCPQCLREYSDPADRRYHAQPNACPVCGPRVWLERPGRGRVDSADPLAAARELLKKGFILAVKGLGGFHLAVDATNDQAVARLRDRKRRPAKPLAVMSPGLEEVASFALPTEAEKELLTSPQRPIVLLLKKNPQPLSPNLAPGQARLGVMLPYTPLHHLLLGSEFQALVMTSGNAVDEPIAVDNQEALDGLAFLADYFLLHDRPILNRTDDSVVRAWSGGEIRLRRSRGYAPAPVLLKHPSPPILAVGGQMKNTFCLVKGDQAFLGPHIGDLDNPKALDFFMAAVDHLERVLGIRPEMVAHDLHPDYQSTRYALERPEKVKIGVQHHQAHLLSCLAERGSGGPALGLALDGSGWGGDGRIWGGEVLIVQGAGFERAAHLAYLPLPGGEAAVAEPWRMAVGWLFTVFGRAFLDLDLSLLRRIGPAKAEAAARMIETGLNCPLTSSLGRLFDAVAALCGLRDQVSYEGQAAAELEARAEPTASRPYELDWVEEGGVRIIRTEGLLRGVVQDLGQGLDPGEISGRFHAALISLFSRLCLLIGQERGLKEVVLSGGVFQNAVLLEGLVKALSGQGFLVRTHSQVPANDGGLCLGQAAAAAAMADEG